MATLVGPESVHGFRLYPVSESAPAPSGVPRAARAERRRGRGGEEEAAVAVAAADVAATHRRLNTQRLLSARPGPAPEPTPSSAAPRPPGRP